MPTGMLSTYDVVLQPLRSYRPSGMLSTRSVVVVVVAFGAVGGMFRCARNEKLSAAGSRSSVRVKTLRSGGVQKICALEFWTRRPKVAHVSSAPCVLEQRKSSVQLDRWPEQLAAELSASEKRLSAGVPGVS